MSRTTELMEKYHVEPDRSAGNAMRIAMLNQFVAVLAFIEDAQEAGKEPRQAALDAVEALHHAALHGGFVDIGF